MESGFLFVNNLWITQRFVAFIVDKSVDNLWISMNSELETMTCPVDNL